MAPSERRQVAALLRRGARMAELHGGWVWDWIAWYAPHNDIRDAALREWHRALPRRREVGISRRVLLALLLADAIEAGDLP